MLLAGVALAAFMAWRGIGNVWTQAAAPQAFYIGAFVVKACVDAHRLDLTPLVSGYGVLVLVPAMLAMRRDLGPGNGYVDRRRQVTNINRP